MLYILCFKTNYIYVQCYAETNCSFMECLRLRVLYDCVAVFFEQTVKLA